MDTTLNSSTSSTPEGGANSPVAPTSTAALPSAPESPTGAPAFVPEAPRSPVQQALERAKARIAKAQPDPAAPAAPESPPAQEQAASSDSTPGEGDTPSSQDETGTSAATTPASTPTAPQHWDNDLQEAFAGIPTDAGKQAMLKVYQSLQAPFTQGMQALRAREQQLDGLLQLQSAFEQDPEAAIREIAKAAGKEVWFERPAPAGEVPEFQTPAELAQWAKQEALRELRESTQGELAKFRSEQAKQRAESEFRAELDAASSKYPDFAEHQQGILQALASWPDLPVERAYQLATYPLLAKQAAEGRTAMQKVQELSAQLRAQSANRMRPATGQVGETKPNGEAHLSPTEKALHRAQRRLAAQAAG